MSYLFSRVELLVEPNMGQCDKINFQTFFPFCFQISRYKWQSKCAKGTNILLGICPVFLKVLWQKSNSRSSPRCFRVHCSKTPSSFQVQLPEEKKYQVLFFPYLLIICYFLNFCIILLKALSWDYPLATVKSIIVITMAPDGCYHPRHLNGTCLGEGWSMRY